MNLFSVTVIALLTICTASPIIDSLPTTTKILSEERKKILKEKIEAVGGCNANICFAIDGSGSISAPEFQNEKNFVLDVVSVVVDDPVELAAVQFATTVSEIQPLTPNDELFTNKMVQAKQLKTASFVVGGINYCFSALFRRPGEANKIVLLSDGKSNIGSSAIDRADLFRSVGGVVSVVGAGFADDQFLLDVAGGNKDLVYEVDNFLDVLSLEKFIEEIVSSICLLS